MNRFRTAKLLKAAAPWIAVAATVGIAAALSACGSLSDSPSKPVSLVPNVDIPRFMGDWYVIAAIPTFLEKGAHNAKDSYRLAPDGTIATVYSHNVDGFTGPLKTYSSTGYVLDKKTNAVWGQQYIWPIKADYRISYLSSDYQHVVVTRDKRDYVWIMSRTPTISEAEYQRMVDVVAREGYDASKLQRVPQASGK